MLRQDSWVLPWLADRPYFDTAPLYFWFAALLANALAWFGVAIHDAARLSTGIWMALALWGAGLAGRELFGRKFGRLSVVLVLGSLGLMIWGHHIAPAALIFAAYAWGIYSFVLALRKPLRAGFMLGLSLLGLLLGASWADAVLMLLMALGLFLFKPWRRLAWAVSLSTALVLSLPLAALWGYALSEQSPELFQTWWRYHAWGPYGGAMSFSALLAPQFLLATLLWFTWPVLPLALWSLWINRRDLRIKQQWILLLWLAFAMLTYLVCAAFPAEAMILPLLIVLSLIAVAGIDELRHGAASALNSFSVLTFGLSAIALWLAWGILLLEAPKGLFELLSRYSSAELEVNFAGLILALVASVLWGGVLLRRRAIGRKALTNWSCGLILLLSIFVGLFQSWVDSGKSYRPVGEKLQSVGDAMQVACIDAAELPLAPLGAIAYFSTLTIKTGVTEGCTLAIRTHQAKIPAHWTLVARTQRLGETREQFSIYLK
ncbi:glycosyltransferase family 39 protein [Chitinibacter sp. GC72]|uniref:ArnT family glycosyltransferase n=1 Tax=Chitinibacter sp. GC72 TaxID=1526917 RepID=UPI0018E02928|nr:hypothetical protein [Chitinibacter sp. GC72]